MRIAVALVLLLPLVAVAEEVDPAAAAAEVRAALPAPNPAIGFRYEGDLVHGDIWAGEVELEARANKFGGASVWKVTEKYFVDMGGAETHYSASYHLDADLTLTGGSAESTHRGRKVSIYFGRTPDGFRVTRKITPPQGEATSETIELAAPKDATYGEAAVLLFARGLKEKRDVSYTLPWVPIVELAMAGGEGTPACSTLTLVPRGKGEAKTSKAKHPSYVVAATRSDLAYDVHLSPDRKGFVAILPESDRLLKWVPRGEGGERIELDEEKPATTWQIAFLKFGYGYHMAREELIAAAFHWPSMYEYETKVAKSWDASKDVEAFKEAWVQEFLANSKHRTRAETDRLLSMTLGTGTVKKETRDEVVFAAHANFGGGVQRTYHLKKVDGLWYLWRIDF